MLIPLVSVIQSFKRYNTMRDIVNFYMSQSKPAMIDCIHTLKVVVPLTNRLLKERLL
jgi:hypothetical protein